MNPEAVEEVKPRPNEDRDDLHITVGTLKAALQIMEMARPKDRAAASMLSAARSLTKDAMLHEWSAAAQMSPIEVPK